MPKNEHFEPTWITWLHERLEGDTRAWAAVNEHVMERYHKPLQIYILGSRFRGLGDPAELVDGFFASRLPQRDYFHRWQQHNKRLRDWLIGGLIHFLHEKIREETKHRAGELTDESVSIEVDPRRAYERRFARSIVEEACRRAAVECARAGLSDHWNVLLGHYFDDRSYRDLGEQLGVTETQARGMARTARDRFRAVLREVLAADGATAGEIDAEINGLISELGS